jgi:hypothetical protein
MPLSIPETAATRRQADIHDIADADLAEDLPVLPFGVGPLARAALAGSRR